MTILNAKKVYLVGIRGVGMAALAIALTKMGKKVLGSDIALSNNSATARVLENQNIQVFQEFDERHIDDSIDFVVVPASHGGSDNIEVQKAVKLGITAISYAQTLGDMLNMATTSISVCGAHGKTNTTALLSSVLLDLGLPITYIVGAAEFNNGNPGGGSTGLKYCVVEADEYVTSVDSDPTPKFLYQNPSYIIATNIDFDHPDVFSSLKDVERVFERFFERLKPRGKVFYCSDDKTLTDLIEKNKTPSVSFGTHKADYIAKNILFIDGKYQFDVYHHEQKLVHCVLQISGLHNVISATGVIALAYELELDITKVVKSIYSFAPAQRRLQKLFDNTITYFDDYAHHPTEIHATLSTLRTMYPERRITMIFQSHTYSRTEALKNEFVKALTQADKTYLLPIYSSVREDENAQHITSEDLVEMAKQAGHDNMESVTLETVVEKLSHDIKQDDIVITVGAGDQVFTLRDILISEFKKRNL